jgi:hypothetical protein
MQPSASWPARSRASPADIREAELKPLRGLGLSVVDILDVVLAAAARCFFSSVLEATGVVTDSAYANLDERLRRTDRWPPDRARWHLSQQRARGPILTKAELRCLSYSRQPVRLCHLDQLCDCQALGFHLRQDPLARRS